MNDKLAEWESQLHKQAQDDFEHYQELNAKRKEVNDVFVVAMLVTAVLRLCDNCKTHIRRENDKYCSHCGAKLPPVDTERESEIFAKAQAAIARLSPRSTAKPQPPSEAV